MRDSARKQCSAEKKKEYSIGARLLGFEPAAPLMWADIPAKLHVTHLRDFLSPRWATQFISELRGLSFLGLGIARPANPHWGH